MIWAAAGALAVLIVALVGVQSFWIAHALGEVGKRLERVDARLDRFDDRFDRVIETGRQRGRARI